MRATDDCGCFDGGACRAWAQTPFCACLSQKMSDCGLRCHDKYLTEASAELKREEEAMAKAQLGGADRPEKDAKLAADARAEKVSVVDMVS